MTGSLQQESGLNPFAVNPQSGAYGIAQWLGSRVADFKAFSGKDLRSSTLEEQLAFHQHELTQGKERKAGDLIRAAKTAADAARIHSEAFERPGVEEAAIGNRQRNAAAALDLLKRSNAAAAARIAPQAVNAATRQGAPQASVQTSETNINGPITIQTQATDANGIAQSIGAAMQKFGLAPQANTGMV